MRRGVSLPLPSSSPLCAALLSFAHSKSGFCSRQTVISWAHRNAPVLLYPASPGRASPASRGPPVNRRSRYVRVSNSIGSVCIGFRWSFLREDIKGSSVHCCGMRNERLLAWRTESPLFCPAPSRAAPPRSSMDCPCTIPLRYFRILDSTGSFKILGAALHDSHTCCQ